MNSPMPSMILASEMRNLPISKPKNIERNQSRMSAPEKPHCSRMNGTASITQQQRQRQLGQPRQRLPARRIEPELGLQDVGDRQADLLRLARQRADREVEQTRHDHHDARQHELVRDEAAERDIAQEGRDDDRRRRRAQIGPLSQIG